MLNVQIFHKIVQDRKLIPTPPLAPNFSAFHVLLQARGQLALVFPYATCPFFVPTSLCMTVVIRPFFENEKCVI